MMRAHLEAILEAAGARIRWVVVTHTHRDHSPLAERACPAHRRARHRHCRRRATGGRTRPSRPATCRRDGERLALGDCELIAIHTPGHASNCVCYLLARERLLFTGDHVLEGVSPVILAARRRHGGVPQLPRQAVCL